MPAARKPPCTLGSTRMCREDGTLEALRPPVVNYSSKEGIKQSLEALRPPVVIYSSTEGIRQ